MSIPSVTSPNPLTLVQGSSVSPTSPGFSRMLSNRSPTEQGPILYSSMGRDALSLPTCGLATRGEGRPRSDRGRARGCGDQLTPGDAW